MENNTKSYTNNQDGFRQEKCISRQIQTIIATLKDATKFTNRDHYLLYIDLKNAFSSIDQVGLLAIIVDLEYHHNVVNLIGNIYSHSSTIFLKPTSNKLPPTYLQRN